MKVSLIITTYNWPEALELCLLSVLNQSRPPDEIIVADDGSRDETLRVIERIAGFSPVPLIHSWQEDKGFRAAKSRNKAMAKSIGDYIILVDGDIILQKHFVRDHVDNARLGSFIQGSRVILAEGKTKEIIASGDITLYFFSRGIENRKNSIRSKLLSLIFSKVSTELEGIRACNTSFWKSDALAVNGFNEDFEGWGREDSEFACRLMNFGVQRFNLKFMADAYHLFHRMCAREHLRSNDAILDNTIKNKVVWCDNGINKY